MAIVVVEDLRDFRLIVGGTAALVGITLGGKVSDWRERKRLDRIHEIEKKKFDALMRR